MAALADHPASSFNKEMLSWEPHVRMVSPCNNMLSGHGFRIASLELSNLDLLHDYYNSVLLVYDIQGHALQQGGATALPMLPSGDEPLRRLLGSLEELLVSYPSAAGVVVNNESDGRLEVRYPVSAAHTSSAVHSPNLLDLDQNKLASSSLENNIEPSSQHIIGTGLSIDTPNNHYPSPYGVQFHVAHANTTLSDLGDVSDPRPCLDLLYPRLQHPTHDSDSDTGDTPLARRSIMAFQLTTFKCGGFTLALTHSHLYADGYSAATFLQNLCSIARGEGLANPPNFQRSRRAALGPREPPSPTMNYVYTFLETRHGWHITSREHTSEAAAPTNHLQYGTSTRYVFSMDALEALRSRGSNPDDAKPCTRAQALFALIWTAYAKVKLRVQRLPRSEEMRVGFSMNVRTRGVNPNLLTAQYMGNALYLSAVSATLGELCEKPLAYVVNKIKGTVEGLDMAEAVQSVLDDIEVKLRDGLVPFIGRARTSVASLVGLPFYDTDCGWGRPTYVGRPSQQLCNRWIILEHPTARAWNVLLVLASAEERACFEEGIAGYISTAST